MIYMLSKKLRNIGFALILDALLASVILLLAGNGNSSVISLYISIKLAILIAGFWGLLMLALRIFWKIDRDRNFLYAFLGTSNMILGLLGICFYFIGKINLIGLHDTLPNLFVGVIVLSDIFLFKSIFSNNGAR